MCVCVCGEMSAGPVGQPSNRWIRPFINPSASQLPQPTIQSCYHVHQQTKKKKNTPTCSSSGRSTSIGVKRMRGCFPPAPCSSCCCCSCCCVRVCVCKNQSINGQWPCGKTTTTTMTVWHAVVSVVGRGGVSNAHARTPVVEETEAEACTILPMVPIFLGRNA
jgi:hypothetical protein